MKNSGEVMRKWWVFLSLLTLVLQLYPSTSALASEESKIHRMLIKIHPHYTRLIFDASGKLPSLVGPLSEGGMTLEFAKLRTSIKPDKVNNPDESAISGISFQSNKDGAKIHIALKDKNATVRQLVYEDAPRDGWYKVVLDFYPQSETRTEAKKTGSDVQRAQNPPEAKPESTQVQPPTVTARQNETPVATQTDSPTTLSSAKATPSPPKKDPLAAANELLAQGNHDQAYTAFENLLKLNNPDVSRAEVLYGLAHSYYLLHEANIAQYASEIINRYVEALRADGSSAQAPIALYRCGLSFAAIDNLEKAEGFFEQVISNHANSPLVGAAWVGLGQARLQKKLFTESVLAFRNALSFPLDKTYKPAAYYGLGKSLSLLNEHEQAVQNLKNCLKEDPLYYRTRPDTLKFLGESLFGLQRFPESQEYLFWYLNLQPATPDRDMILARLSETLSNGGDAKLSKNLQDHIQNEYPDSEGSIITQIRAAEALENSDQKTRREHARTIYQELAGKDLPQPVSKMIRFKLAKLDWKNGDYETALSTVNELLQEIKDAPATMDPINLKRSILADWIKKAYSEKDHPQVVKLYMQNSSSLQNSQPSELNFMVAESCKETKFYANAMEAYEKLLSKGGERNDQILVGIAECAYQMGDTDKALQTLGQVKAASLEGLKAELLARIYFLQESYPKVVQSIEKLIQKDKELSAFKPELILILSESLMRMGKNQEGLSWLQKALDHLGQGDQECLIRATLLQSQCYANLKQPKKAIEVIEAVIPLVASQDLQNQLNYQLSGLYMESEQKDKAVQKLNALLGASESLWKTAARQRLDYIQMHGQETGAF